MEYHRFVAAIKRNIIRRHANLVIRALSRWILPPVRRIARWRKPVSSGSRALRASKINVFHGKR